MKNIYSAIIIILITASSFLFSQTTELPNYRTSNYEGKHFLVAFMQNEITTPDTGNDLILFITATQNAKVNSQKPRCTSRFRIQYPKEQCRPFPLTVKKFSLNESEVISKTSIGN